MCHVQFCSSVRTILEDRKSGVAAVFSLLENLKGVGE